MAYAPDVSTNDEEQLKAYLNSGQNGAPGVTTASAPGPVSAAPKAGGAPANSASQPSTNLQAYLTVNAPRSEQNAQNIATDLSNQYNTTKQAVDTAGTEFGQQVQSSYNQPDNTVVQNALANPTQFVQNPDNLTAWNKIYNNAYTGPTSFTGSDLYGGAQSAVQKAGDTANLLQNEAGVKTYLAGKQPTSGPSYTQGEQTLDAVLLRQNPQAIQTITQAAQPLTTLADYFKSAAGTQDTAAQTAQQLAAQTAADARNQFAQTNTGFETGLNAAVKAAQTGATDQVSALAAKLAAKQQLTPAELQALNIADAPTLSAIYNAVAALQTDYGQTVNPATWLQPTGTPDMITKENFATPEQYNEALALAQLAGVQPSFLTSDTLNLAGTAPKDLADYNTTQAQQGTVQALKQKDTALINSIVKTVDSAGRQNGWAFQTPPYAPTQQMQDAFSRIGRKLIHDPISPNPVLWIDVPK